MANPATVWVDVEDLFIYSENHARPSGIQRLAFEICAALMNRFGEAGQVRFVRHILQYPYFRAVSWESLRIRFDDMHLVTNRPAPAETPDANRFLEWHHYLKVQGEAFTALAATCRSLAGAIMRRPDELPSEYQFGETLRDGDVLLAVGSPWFPQYAARLRLLRKRFDLHISFLIYDIIPLRHPEWCHPRLTAEFTEWMHDMLPLADRIFAISHATADDVERYAAGVGIELQTKVQPVPIGTGFRPPAVRQAAMRPGLPTPGTYALFVSTIEPRKNHALLLGVWRRLLVDMERDAVPDLVFAGGVGWMVEDLMAQLENCHYLDGKVRFVKQPSDAELLALYRGCLFTLFPSFYEGWGLPVSESLAFGKPCIISCATSLPEAGGALARYFDPNDMGEAERAVRGVLQDRLGLAAWEAEVVQRFAPVSWDATALALLRGLAG